MPTLLQEYGALALVVIVFTAVLLAIIYWPAIRAWAERERQEWG